MHIGPPLDQRRARTNDRWREQREQISLIVAVFSFSTQRCTDHGDQCIFRLLQVSNVPDDRGHVVCIEVAFIRLPRSLFTCVNHGDTATLTKACLQYAS